MKLYLNPPSPYARKVVGVAHELGQAEGLEIVKVDPWSDPQVLTDVTPLCRVPALVTADGRSIVESTTICEYLMEQAGKPLPSGTERFNIMARAAIAHGMMDAAFNSVIEKRRPKDKQWPEWISRQYRAINRTLPIVDVPPKGRFDLGDVTLACTLAYFDVWVAGDVVWRSVRRDLADWLDSVSKRRSMVASRA